MDKDLKEILGKIYSNIGGIQFWLVLIFVVCLANCIIDVAKG